MYLCAQAFVLVVVSYHHAFVGASAIRQRTVGELTEETGHYQSIRLKNREPLVFKTSAHQTIGVYESHYFGKMLVLDGVVQLTERDADAYNEMMAHIPMFQHPQPKRVLVIGGGDGYVVSEVLKHESVEHVDHVDLDIEVIEVCREQFAWGSVWDDPRVHLHIADGSLYVQNAADSTYDVIIQDSSDPWTWDAEGRRVDLPSGALYTQEHLKQLYRILTSNGVTNLQAEALQIPSDLNGIVKWRQLAFNVGFVSARYASVMISSYPTGQIGCLLFEKAWPTEDIFHSISERYNRMCEAGRNTSYYHPRLQNSSFDLPLWAEKRVYGHAGAINPACKVQEERWKIVYKQQVQINMTSLCD